MLALLELLYFQEAGNGQHTKAAQVMNIGIECRGMCMLTFKVLGAELDSVRAHCSCAAGLSCGVIFEQYIFLCCEQHVAAVPMFETHASGGDGLR